jgi:hypothetical protein
MSKAENTNDTWQAALKYAEMLNGDINEDKFYAFLEGGRNYRNLVNSDSFPLVNNCVKCGDREGKGKTKQCDTCLMDGIV